MNTQNNLVIPKIHSYYESMSKTEKRIADYVFKNASEIIYMTIMRFAENAKVSDASIVRFCRKLEFSSFQSFKLALGLEIASTSEDKSDSDLEIRDDDTLEALIDKTWKVNVETLNETKNFLDTALLEESCRIIRDSSKIFFVGSGMSQITAQYSAVTFARIGLNAISYENSHFQSMQAALLTENDCVVAISYSGTTRDTCKVAKIAKEAGARVICITYHGGSPITEIADVVLLHGARETLLDGGTSTTKIAQFFIVDSIYKAVYREMKTKARDKRISTLYSVIDDIL